MSDTQVKQNKHNSQVRVLKTINQNNTNSIALVNMQLKEKKQKEQKPPAFVQRPKTLVCYICGREYGTMSLKIHIKSCMKKFDID